MGTRGGIRGRRIGTEQWYVLAVVERSRRDWAGLLSVKDIDVYDVEWHAMRFEFLCHRLLKYGIYSDEANIVSESIGSNSRGNRREHLIAHAHSWQSERTTLCSIFMLELISWL